MGADETSFWTPRLRALEVAKKIYEEYTLRGIPVVDGGLAEVSAAVYETDGRDFRVGEIKIGTRNKSPDHAWRPGGFKVRVFVHSHPNADHVDRLSGDDIALGRYLAPLVQQEVQVIAVTQDGGVWEATFSPDGGSPNPSGERIHDFGPGPAYTPNINVDGPRGVLAPLGGRGTAAPSGPAKPKGGGKGPPKGPGGGGKGKGPSETSPTNPPEKGTTGSSRGSDYRESGGPKPSKDSGTTSTGASSQEKGKTADDKAKDKDKKTDKEKEEEKGGKKGKSDGGWGGDVGTVVVGGEGQIREAGWTAGVSGGKPVSASDDAPQQPADAQPPEDPPAEDDGSETGSGGGNNTTRGNPLDDDGGESDHESRRFTHHYMPPETRALFAFTELGRALAPKGPPLPGSGGPTDRGWTPFRARTAAAGPPESAAYGREALKNAFADGSLGGALAGRPYHGRPTDDGGQVPVAADARTSGDESDADAKASRDAVRQMIWNKFAAPRIRYARRIR